MTATAVGDRRGLTPERIQLWSAACGWAFPLVLFGGIILAGFLPPPSPGQSAEEVKAMYQDGTDLRRLGFTLLFVGAGIQAPLFVAISQQLDRIPGAKALSRLQLMAAALSVLAVLLPSLFFLTAAFDPDRPAEVTKALHDLAMIPFIGNWVPATIQGVAVGLAVLMQRGPTYVLPRWFGYLNLWLAFLFIAGTFVWFFQEGALAWNGAVTFWIVAVTFGLWFNVMAVVLRKAIKEQYA